MTTTPKTTRKAAPAATATKAIANAEARPDAVSSPEMINIFEEALVREAGGRQRETSSSKARLFVKAWVNNIAYEKRVWVNVDILGRTGKPLRSESLTLGYVEPAGGSGDFFLVDAPVPPPAAAGGRATAELLEYRLYYEVCGQVFTDGVPHRHPLRPARTP